AAVQRLDLAHVALEGHVAPHEGLRGGGGEEPAPDGGADPLAREIASEPRRIPHQHEARAGKAPRRLATHDAGVALERLGRHSGGPAAPGAEGNHERPPPPPPASLAPG